MTVVQSHQNGQLRKLWNWVDWVTAHNKQANRETPPFDVRVLGNPLRDVQRTLTPCTHLCTGRWNIELQRLHTTMDRSDTNMLFFHQRMCEIRVR